MWPQLTSEASPMLFPHSLLCISSVFSLAYLAHDSFLRLEGVLNPPNLTIICSPWYYSTWALIPYCTFADIPRCSFLSALMHISSVLFIILVFYYYSFSIGLWVSEREEFCLFVVINCISLAPILWPSIY